MNLRGQTVLITGANTGIGRATAVALAEQGAELYLAGRSEERHRDILAEVKAAGGRGTYLPLDLGDLASVRACARQFLSLDRPLHVLLNNAGLARSRGTTADGFERTFGVNHLGHFLLTELLLNRLRESAPSRIINVASHAHYSAKHIDWESLRQSTRTMSGLPEYSVSKLCNVLHARSLAERLEGTGVAAVALHPGVIASDVWRNVPWGIRHAIRLFMQSTEQGAATSIHCATSDEIPEHSGGYLAECRPKEPSAAARDPQLARELHEKSSEWVGTGV